MTYPGNPSLATEAKTRISSTYNQSLQLAQQGRLQEASLGCDLILKLDPLFFPASELQTQLQRGGGADLSMLAPLELAATEPAPAPAAVAVAEPDASFELPELAELPTFEVDDAPGAQALPSRGSAPLSSRGSAAASSRGPAASGGGRIDELLREGDALFDQRDYQGAIDAWSRIYLIDIDHAEASRRIDRARLLKEEKDRQVEELFHQATALRDAGHGDEARAGFARVLELQPEHLGARASLERLDREVASAAVPPSRGDQYLEEGTAEEPLPDDEAFADDAGELPPLPTAAPKKARAGKAAPAAAKAPAARGAKSKARSRSRLLVLGGVVAVVLGAGAWFLLRNQNTLFPNAQEEAAPAVAPSPRADPIAQAEQLQQSGALEQAIAALEQIAPGDENEARARTLLADWRSELAAQKKAIADRAAQDQQAEAKQQALRERLLEAARGAYNRREYLLAARGFRDAEKIASLTGEASDLYENTKRQLVPLAKEMDLFRQGEYELVLPNLWRFNDRDPENRDVRRLLSDCYYNLGVRELQRGSPQDAAEQFSEMKAFGAEPPEVLERLFSYCDAYRNQPKDLLYRIFVGTMKLRR